MSINVDSYPIILDHCRHYEGGFGMDLDHDYMNTYDDPYPISTMLLDDNMSSQDIQTLILHNHFQLLDHHHHQYHQNNIQITNTEDVIVYFEDPVVPDLVVAEESLHKNVTEDPILQEVSSTTVEDVSMTQTTSNDMDLSSTVNISTSSSPSSSFVFLTKGMVDKNDELIVFHLVMAYAEAMEMGQEELAAVIAKRISEKVSPVGDSAIERLMYHMFNQNLPADYKQPPEEDYLRQESMKNFHQAFKAFYQIFPHGKLAHFAANLAILESLPKAEDDVILRIFDFDIGEGIQWASLIEAMGSHNHGHGLLEMRLTSLKFVASEMEEEQLWKFQDTKRRLCDYAESYGLKLEMDEMEWDNDDDDDALNMDSASSSRKEFYVFNCMVGLPHMGRVRRRRDVFNFLQKSHVFLGGNTNGRHGYNKKGIVTFGDGEAWEKARNAFNYASYLDENMAHYQALLESIEHNFPSHLGDARTAMECLFVAPFASCKSWAEKWVERKRYGDQDWVSSSRFGGLMEGLSWSKESLLEAKEVAREGESLYRVRVEGECHNELIMEWREIPLVKVSCWKST
ncbi:OLC1v1033677C1 [Oldenlandia corymbosa var. corymbosa]|uniref:OLC1v1033677C1 n=1 Tax=Oldenlandia corymbosa var. corymbosa TaxID=529605 RepID=A0AAV1CRQ5_OLDCO|nr:OLC1v1033677C1 [Oldenlandia corymbosa var. corymbosa]